VCENKICGNNEIVQKYTPKDKPCNTNNIYPEQMCGEMGLCLAVGEMRVLETFHTSKY